MKCTGSGGGPKQSSHETWRSMHCPLFSKRPVPHSDTHLPFRRFSLMRHDRHCESSFPAQEAQVLWQTWQVGEVRVAAHGSLKVGSSMGSL